MTQTTAPHALNDRHVALLKAARRGGQADAGFLWCWYRQLEGWGLLRDGELTPDGEVELDRIEAAAQAADLPTRGSAASGAV